MTVEQLIAILQTFHSKIEVRMTDDGAPPDYESTVHSAEIRYDEPDYDYVLIS